MTKLVDRNATVEEFNEFYQTELEEIVQSHINPDERVFAVAEHSLDENLGITIITSYRVLLVTYMEYDKERIYFPRNHRNLFRDEHIWLPRRLAPLTSEALRSREIFECMLASIKSILRYEHSITYQGKQIKLIELICLQVPFDLPLFSIILDEDTGNEIYHLLEMAMKVAGRIRSKEKASAISFLELLTGFSDREVISCPFCSEPIALDSGICENCGRPPGSDKYVVLRESIFRMAKNIIAQEHSSSNQTENEEVSNVKKLIALMLCQLLNEVEVRKPGPVDSIAESSFVAVSNANFIIETAVKNEALYPGTANEFHRTHHAIQKFLQIHQDQAQEDLNVSEY
ncbi:MAG TPA: hypothetical protein PKH77_28295 [Anaerolineae bacterium]|nr:hypothetical protein [Anaerolineae bacterium]